MRLPILGAVIGMQVTKSRGGVNSADDESRIATI